MTLDDHISRVMSCTKDAYCANGQSCHEIALYAHRVRGNERLQMALARVHQVEIDEDELQYFAPPLHWESHLPPRWK
jgi:hypothetical protein